MNRTSAPNSASGLYVDDNPATSTQGTLLIATDLNQRQEEIVNTIELSGITPSSGDDTQLGQAVRKLSGLGDYCDETIIDLSSAPTSIDLTSFFSMDDGWVESWVWSGGDGTYQLDWDDATYSGKTIGGVTANTLTADLKGEGQGRLTLRKQGNDARILYFVDQLQVTYGSIVFLWEKDATGKHTKRGYLDLVSGGNINESYMATNLNPLIPNVGDFLMLTGSVDIGSAIFSMNFLYRSSASVVSASLTSSTGTNQTYTIDDDGSSGTWPSLDAIKVFIETKNTRWTTSYPVVG